MAKQTRKNLSDRSVAIKNELTEGANTATKIGSLEQDIIDTAAMEWDSTRPYAVGEIAVWQGRIVTCFSATLAGQSPATHAVKWTDPVADSLEKLADGSPNYPVLVSALKAYVTQRIGEVNAGDGTTIPKATTEQINAGTDNNAYITSLGLQWFRDALLTAMAAIMGVSKGTLQEILQNDPVAQIVPFFEGGIAANLQEGSNGLPVGVADDGTFYKTPGEAFVAWLAPYLASLSPATAPTVDHVIPDQTITDAGDQTFTFAANTFSGINTYTATKEDGSPLPILFNGPSRTFTILSAIVNQTLRVKVIATNPAGLSNSTVFTMTVARTVDLPYFVSIVRRYIAPYKSLSYHIKSSYQSTDVSKLPVWRCRRSDETTWRSDFGPMLSSEGLFADFTTGYREFISATLAAEGEAFTTSVFQFKPYPGAPDSTIKEFTYTQNNAIDSAGDTGTPVYTFSPGSAKIKGLWVARITGAEKYLSVYADGSGELRTNLVATGSTPAYSGGLKVMVTAGGPFANSSLFTGTVPYGSLYAGVLNGTYNLTLSDENGNSETFIIVITDTGPIIVLKEPVAGSTDSDLTTVHAFTGTPTGGHRSTDPSLLAMTYDFIGGLICNLRNTASHSPGSGHAIRYLINDQWYAFASGLYYMVDDSATVSSTGLDLKFSPQLGVLVQYYEVDTSRPVYAWRDNPITAASQLVRSL